VLWKNGVDILYVDSNKPAVRKPIVKFVTLVLLGVRAGFPDEHSSKFGWDGVLIEIYEEAVSGSFFRIIYLR
jgi:hypothetical protein